MTRTGVIVVVILLTVGVGGGPAAAAPGPTFTGGGRVAPYGSAGTPSVASNGSEVLVVWSERVAGTYGIYGRLTSGTTNPIGPRITIHLVAGKDSLLPDVAWSGTRWLVVWQHAFSAFDRDIQGRLVEPSGAVSAVITVEAWASDQLDPAVSVGPDGGFLVVWEDLRNEARTLSDVYGRRLTGEGELQSFEPGRFSVDGPDGATTDANPDVATYGIGDLSVVAYEAQGQGRSMILSRDVHRNGRTDAWVVVVDHPSSRRVGAPSLGVGERFLMLLAYEEDRGGTRGVDISGARFVAGNGPEAPFTISSQPGSEQQPAVAFNGTYVVAWTDRRNDPGGDIYGRRVRNYGDPLDPAGFVIANGTPEDDTPALTSGTAKAGTFVAAWEATPAGRGPGTLIIGIDHPEPK